MAIIKYLKSDSSIGVLDVSKDKLPLKGGTMTGTITMGTNAVNFNGTDLKSTTSGELDWNGSKILSASNIDTTIPETASDDNVPSTKFAESRYLSKYTYSGSAAMTKIAVAGLIATGQLEFLTVQFDEDNSPDGSADTVWFVELSRGTVQKTGETELTKAAYLRATSFTSKDQYLCLSSDDGQSFGDWTKQTGGGASGDYLKLDGTSTMTGAIVSSDTPTLKQLADTNDTTIYGGTTKATGASLMLAGASSTTQTAGNFELRLGDGATVLKGNQTDKVLSWNGNKVLDGSVIATSLTESCTDSQVASAKAVYDIIGTVATQLNTIDSGDGV